MYVSFRKGFNTTHGTKITACSRLKTMIENNKMSIKVSRLYQNLKDLLQLAVVSTQNPV